MIIMNAVLKFILAVLAARHYYALVDFLEHAQEFDFRVLRNLLLVDALRFVVDAVQPVVHGAEQVVDAVQLVVDGAEQVVDAVVASVVPDVFHLYLIDYGSFVR